MKETLTCECGNVIHFDLPDGAHFIEVACPKCGVVWFLGSDKQKPTDQENLTTNNLVVLDLCDKLAAVSSAPPGSELCRLTLGLLEAAKTWPAPDKHFLVEHLSDLVKRKRMNSGKIEKKIKTVFREYREV